LKVFFTAGHLALGALMLATSLIITLWCFKMTRRFCERQFVMTMNQETAG